jgi:hypothetical protein
VRCIVAQRCPDGLPFVEGTAPPLVPPEESEPPREFPLQLGPDVGEASTFPEIVVGPGMSARAVNPCGECGAPRRRALYGRPTCTNKKCARHGR